MTRTLPVLIILSVLLAAFPSHDSFGQETAVPARYRTALRVGYANEPPYSFRNSSGEVTGESPEALKAAAARLGIASVRWVLMSFSSLLDELEAGRIDAVAAGLFVTPARQARVRFSIPTAVVRQGLLVPAGNPLGLRTYQDAAAARVSVAVLDGAVEQDMLGSLGMPTGGIYSCQDVETALSALGAGRVAAVALSEPTVAYLAGRSKGRFEAVRDAWAPASAGTKAVNVCALAFRKKDKELAEAFDSALSVYVGSQGHRAVLERLGFGPDSVPGK